MKYKVDVDKVLAASITSHTYFADTLHTGNESSNL